MAKTERRSEQNNRMGIASIRLDNEPLLVDKNGDVLVPAKPVNQNSFPIRVSGKTKVDMEGPVEVSIHQEEEQPNIPILYSPEKQPLLFRLRKHAIPTEQLISPVDTKKTARVGESDSPSKTSKREEAIIPPAARIEVGEDKDVGLQREQDPKIEAIKPDIKRSFRTPFDWEKQPNQAKEKVITTFQPEVEKPKWQIKDEEWTRRWKIAFSEKPAFDADKPKSEPEVEVEDSVTNISASKRPGPDVLPGTGTQARINGAAREPKLKVKNTDAVKETEKKAATEETEAGKQEQLSILARLLQDYNEQQKLKQKYEEKWFNEELAVEEKARENTARLLAEADAKVVAQKAETDGKIATAREEGEKAGKKKLWEDIKRPRGIKEKLKILFSRHPEPKTDEEKVAQYKRDIYRTVVLAGVGGALAMLGTWAVAQYFGFFLPTPIKNLIIHTKQIINR